MSQGGPSWRICDAALGASRQVKRPEHWFVLALDHRFPLEGLVSQRATNRLLASSPHGETLYISTDIR